MEILHGPATGGIPHVNRKRWLTNIIILLLCILGFLQVISSLITSPTTTPSANSPSSLYKMLHIRANATVKEIKKARSARVLATHPDKNPNGAEEYLLVQEAYETLSDPHKRFKYDCGFLAADMTFQQLRDCILYSRTLDKQRKAATDQAGDESEAKQQKPAANEGENESSEPCEGQDCSEQHVVALDQLLSTVAKSQIAVVKLYAEAKVFVFQGFKRSLRSRDLARFVNAGAQVGQHIAVAANRVYIKTMVFLFDMLLFFKTTAM